MPELIRPFRWDLVRPDQLGTLLDGAKEPDLWFLDELIECAAKMLARSAGGESYFVGRSLDSAFDLLSGVVDGTSWQERLHRLELSFAGSMFGELHPAETARLRTHLGAAGLTPAALARGSRPVVFLDVVSGGSTFGELHEQLRLWVADERGSWDVVRRKLRFIAVTSRRQTSPKTWRWHEHVDWTSSLPAGAIQGVSLDSGAFSYFADRQTKLTRSFPRWHWSDESVQSPSRFDGARDALAEAVALVENGRTKETRGKIRRYVNAEPTIAEPWLRALQHELR